ncbi:MAG: ParA family protein [Leptospiraceae bacterium]|nr:ParA family protein [Leptospiraceae bacterium]
MSKKKESWATKFAEFPDSENEKTFEVLLSEMVELVFGYSYKNGEIKYQENYTDIHCRRNTKLHGLVIEAKGPKANAWPIIQDSQYEIPNIQLSEYMLQEFTDGVGNAYYPKYGMLVNKRNLILYENRFGKLIKIFDYTEKNNKSILIDTDKKLQTIKKNLTRNQEKRDSLIVTVFNNKGGVGKSTISYGLSKSISEMFAKRVFAVDLDPLQADLSRLFKINNKEKIVDVLKLLDFKKSNIEQKLEEIRKDKKFLLHSNNNIHVALSNPEEKENKQKSFYDAHKEITWAGKTKLKEVAGKLRPFLKTGIPVEGYDITILDAPAGWWFYSILAVLVSDIILIPISAKSKSSWKNASRFLSYYLPNLLEEFELQPSGRLMPGPFIVNLLEENSSKQSHSATIDEMYDFIREELKPVKGNKDSLLDYLFPNTKNKGGYPNFDDSEKTPTLSDSKSITTFDLQKKENFKDLPDKSKREFYNLTKALFPLIDKVID